MLTAETEKIKFEVVTGKIKGREKALLHMGHINAYAALANTAERLIASSLHANEDTLETLKLVVMLCDVYSRQHRQMIRNIL